VLASLLALLSSARPVLAVPSFTDATAAAGISYSHGYTAGLTSVQRGFAGGVAAGDYNNDGYVDLYVIRGDVGPNLLFKNMKNGTFQEVGASAGVNVTGARGSGPAFADWDGDGWLDLLIGGIETTTPTLFRNLGNGTFQNVTATSGVSYTDDTFSSTFGDYDRDGDIDIFMTHWGAPQIMYGHLWRNNGTGTFTSVDTLAGFVEFGPNLFENLFTANFADINNDDWPDLLLASDFGTSEIYRNDVDGTFTCVTTPVIYEDNGMGAAVADYDADGDLDWFVSSIYDTCGCFRTGNRLYRNSGTGTFTDVTDAAGVRVGYWGWGSTFVDLDNDGHLDLFHVNGWGPPFEQDPARLFMSDGDATFTEMAGLAGVAHTGRGLGVSCFDLERDGDLDLFIANNSGAPVLYRNAGGSNKYLTIKLKGNAPNTEGIGARVLVTIGATTQMREIKAGCNYVSQDPAEAHFGLGNATVVNQVRVEWPNGQVTTVNNVPVNHYWVISQSGITGLHEGPAPAARGGDILFAGAGPNPFAAAATFRFHLPAAAPAVVRIFDAAGRSVRTLHDAVGAAGAGALAWDGRDAAGAAVPAGTYLYRLESMGRSFQGKLTLIR
jgi:hypothetical protein